MSTEEIKTPNVADATAETERELPPGDPTSDLQAEVGAVSAERDKLLAEKQELYDRLLRAQAEFENARRRAERERSEFVQYAGMEIVREILPVVDDFQRAIESGSNVADGHGKEYVKGVELIYQRLIDRLQKLGLEPIVTKDALFDPNLHQAVDRVETRDVPDQTILSEYQAGYFFKGRLLRPSMVKVAVRP